MAYSGGNGGFGVSFMPGGDQQYQRPGGNVNPVQEAIRVLSLRVPKVVGASPLAPLALMTSKGSGGLPSGLVENLLRSLAPPGGTPTTGVPQTSLVPAPAASLPEPAAPPVPGPTPPTAPGIAPGPEPPTPAPSYAPPPSMATAKPTMQPVTVSGAASPYTPPAPIPAQSYSAPPLVSVTAGATDTGAEAPPPATTTPQETLTAAPTPEPSMTAREERQDAMTAEDLWELSRRLRSRM
jgi:hypothetical protein